MLTLRNPRAAIQPLIAAGLLLGLAGCASTSSKFSCPAPDGLTCMNPVEVYEATNGDGLEVDTGKAKARKKDRATPTTIVVQPVAPAPAPAPAAVGPDRCCEPVLSGITVGKNDSLSLTRPTTTIAPSQADASVVNRDRSRREVQVPEGDAYREAAKIMRIYVAPWEDDRGDLHMGGHIYTEIEPRRWRIGQRPQDVRTNTFSLLKGQVAAASDEVASSEPGKGTTDGFTNPQR